jgi:hypothetical protein
VEEWAREGRERRRRTTDRTNEPNRVDGHPVLRHLREQPTVGKATVAGEGVEGAGGGLESGGNNGEGGEADEGPEDVEAFLADVADN